MGNVWFEFAVTLSYRRLERSRYVDGVVPYLVVWL